MSKKLEDALEISLQQLNAGANLAEVLESQGSHAAELEPLLKTALMVSELTAEVHISPVTQNRSRGQFLSTAAATIPTPRRSRFSLFHLRLAASSLIFAGMVAMALLGTGLASAAALPGDVFYPVKRMVETIQVNLAQDPPARLKLEENLDGRRLEEASRLSEKNRREFVTFSGLLRETADGGWMVGDLVLRFPSDTPTTQMVGRYVQVTGYSDTHQVDVEDIQLRSFAWQGIIQKLEGDTWLVGGIQVTIDDNTLLGGADPQVGAVVHVTAMRLPDNSYLAVTVEVAPLARSTYHAIVQPTHTGTTEKAAVVLATKVDSEEVKKTESPHASRTPTVRIVKSATAPTRRATATPTPREGDNEERKSSPTHVPSSTPTPNDTHD